MPRSTPIGRRRFLLAAGGAALLGVVAVPAAAQTASDPVARLAELDAATTALADEIDAAQVELGARRTELTAAAATADRAAVVASAAGVRAAVVRARVDDLVGASYSGARTSRLSALLVAQSPQEMLDRMSVLDLLGTDAARALEEATAAATVADDAEAGAVTARDAAAVAEAQAVAVQTALVARRAELAAQTAEANALLSSLGSTVPAARLAPSLQASTLRASRATATRDSLFVVPAQGRFTSGYGARGGSAHNGIDIANTTGTPIVSAADGVVVDAGPASGFGLWVRVQHADGTVTTYGHNDTNTVRAGQQVAAGEQIATIGNRGQSTGPHVHFEVAPGGGSTVDPRAWLAARGVTV